MKKVLGIISVDSGQLMIGDPCYLRHWEANDFRYESGVRHKETNDKVIYRKDVLGWDLPIERLGGRCLNDLVDDPDWERYERYLDNGEYSYSGACAETCSKRYGVLGDGRALAVSTLHGDGGYAVEGVLDARGRVKRIVVDFDAPEYLLFGVDAVELYGKGVGACTIRDDGHEYMVLTSDCDWRELMGARDRFGSWCEISESDYMAMQEASL